MVELLRGEVTDAASVKAKSAAVIILSQFFHVASPTRVTQIKMESDSVCVSMI